MQPNMRICTLADRIMFDSGFTSLTIVQIFTSAYNCEESRLLV